VSFEVFTSGALPFIFHLNDNYSQPVIQSFDKVQRIRWTSVVLLALTSRLQERQQLIAKLGMPLNLSSADLERCPSGDE
jgi:hypothetical protein